MDRLFIIIIIVYIKPFYEIAIEVTPLQDSVAIGGQTTFEVNITNNENAPQVITLFCAGETVVSWCFTTPRQEVTPGQSFSTTRTITANPDSPGPLFFTVGVQLPVGILFTKEIYITDSIEPALFNGEWIFLVGMIIMIVAFVGSLYIFISMRKTALLRLDSPPRVLEPSPTLELRTQMPNIIMKSRNQILILRLDKLIDRIERLKQ
jgi:hypothetical protein